MSMWVVIILIIVTTLVATMLYIASKQEKDAQKQEVEKRNIEFEKRRPEVSEYEKRKRNRIKYLEDTAVDKYRILDVEIAGLYYRPSKTHEIAGTLDVGDLLDLKVNPSNEYDPYAVKVLYNDTWLGFIPQSESEDVFKAIRKKERFIAVVSSTDKGCIPHIRIKIFPREDRRLLDYL